MLRTTAAAFAFILFIAFTVQAADTTPAVTGPIAGGTYGRPFTAALMDLSSVGYVEQEYFLEGKADTYGPVPSTALSADGRWRVMVTGNQPYKTRILVRRPADAKRFNGTVVVEWFQATAGFDKDVNWMWQKDEITREGYVWVGVSAQRESVNGTPTAPAGTRFKDLVRWDESRYGSLSIPSEDLAYDIFSQVAMIVGPNRRRQAVDPMAGLKVEKVLAIGDTFAADKLVTYYDGVEPTARVFDGFFIGSRHIKGAAPLAEGVAMPEIVQLRGDVKAPVIISNSDAESPPHFPARQPDSPTYRLWEIAGGAHTNAYWAPQMYAAIERDLGTPVPACPDPFNRVPNQFVMNAGLAHLNTWARGGAAPPSFPSVRISGTPPALERDADGNTLGGVRLPELTVPMARYETGGDRKCQASSGFTKAFTPERVKALYPAKADYLAKYKDAVEAGVKAGFILRADADKAIAAAAAP